MHISFVRSIAMDSWTDQQLKLMKAGGNNKCNEYLKKHGIDARTPIKQKYESPAAQLYKEVLKARVEGRPEPTELPKPVAKASPQRQASPASLGSNDPNGMERLAGETEAQYVARQTRLREEAKARMAAKFGSSGGRMGGVGSGGQRMSGIGSDPNYNPNGGYGGGMDLNVDSLVSTFGSAVNSVTAGVSSIVNENNLSSLKQQGGSFWGSLTSSVNQVASSIAKPDAGSDGLSDLQRQFQSNKPAKSIYAGFGSDTYGGNSSATSQPSPSPSSASPAAAGGGGGLQEAQGLPGEDRNGIERLTGESDEQYVMRQTRLREEARARMAAKFGGGGLGGVGSSSSPAPGGVAPSRSYSPKTVSAPSSGNSPFASGGMMNGGAHIASAPSSGNFPPKTPPKQAVNSTDFFSSFGT